MDINNAQSAQNPARQFLKKGLFFVVMIALTFGLFFSSVNLNNLVGALRQAHIGYLSIAGLCMALSIVCEALNIGRGLKVQGILVSFKKKIVYAFYGFFFSAITPSASGGQPLQLYAMHKDRIDVAQGTLSLLFELASFQIATLSFAIFGMAFKFDYIYGRLGAGILIVYLGLGLNALVLLFLGVALFSRRLANGVVALGLRVAGFFFPQKRDAWADGAHKQLEQYYEGALLIKKHKLLSLQAVATSLVQILALHSITYWVYMSLGLGNESFFTILALQSVLFISVSSLPLPGAVGANEGGFLLLFKLIFPATMLDASMVLSRGVSFYAPVLITGISIAIWSMTSRPSQKSKPALQD